LVAALVARLTEQPVSAGTDGDVVLGQANTTGGFTSITCTAGGGTGLTTQCTNGATGWGVDAVGNQYGVAGTTLGSAGAGVAGFGAGNSPGVLGDGRSAAVGVVGQAASNYGMLGLIPASSSANTIAIYAQNYSTYAGASSGAGGFAIYGLCAKGHGLVGATATAGAAAVVGATNGVAGAFAAAFYGPVIVGGALTVVGGPKSAAVPYPDGSHRRLYCLESPESWFEDFGTGLLECGRADVPIDPDFATVVNLSDYHVFLTPYDSDSVLHVSHRTSAGFSVEADPEIAALKGKKGTDLEGTFSWRVVAKRKDIKGERFATVTIPPEPRLPPPVPDLPVRPKS
jgi:hypothetical protein